MMARTYVAIFMGQGGILFSSPMYGIANAVRRIGATADVYRYIDIAVAQARMDWFRRQGYAIAGIGYSLGTSTLTYMQTTHPFNLVCCIAMSNLENVWPINHSMTRRSVLWHGSEIDFLSGQGEQLGFDVIHQVPSFPVLGHLIMPLLPSVVNGVVAEVRQLLVPTKG